ncbi:MAG: glycosyl transferase [Proteobacteria bacterium]|nr:MAG: glycosyl transferase [Pseudomonadota bacterium]
MIPRHFHFVFGLRPQSEPFHLVHYLCLKSCMVVNQPEKVSFYYHYEPYGEWWEKIKPGLELVRVEPVDFLAGTERYGEHEEGRFIRRWGLDYAHHADFLRLEILMNTGGVYADIDTLFVKPMPGRFFRKQFVMGREVDTPHESDGSAGSLCNALMLSEPNAEFARLWHRRMYSAFDGSWSRHSNQEATRLSRQHPDLITVLPRECFYKFGFTPMAMARLFAGLQTDLGGVYSIHLWEHLWWDEDRTDFCRFHAGLLTRDYIENRETTYSVLARRFLD